jgi:hypothetical protein
VVVEYKESRMMFSKLNQQGHMMISDFELTTKQQQQQLVQLQQGRSRRSRRSRQGLGMETRETRARRRKQGLRRVSTLKPQVRVLNCLYI